jgi:hypothetical protein
MTQWPQPEKRIPEGHFSFRLNREPELKKFIYKDKHGNDKEGRRLIVYAVGLSDEGEFSVVDSFLPWEDRYVDLCAALKVEHGRDIEMAGATFEADIKYEPMKKDPTKSWPRIVNIVVPEKLKEDEAGDDIPF